MGALIDNAANDSEEERPNDPARTQNRRLNHFVNFFRLFKANAKLRGV